MTAIVTHTHEDWTYIIGQDWDVVSPLGPTTYNLVGHYFQTGELGFMRLQAQILKKDGQFEHAFAFGIPTNTNGNVASGNEYCLYPTLALRETISTSKSKFEASGMIGNVKLASVPEKTIQPNVITLFAHHEVRGYELNTEAYYG